VTAIVVYDANVLYPSALRDLLIRVGDARLVQPKWTEAILDETFRSLIENRPDLDSARLQRTRELMSGAIRDVLVEGYEQYIEQVSLPDSDDRHVLAAAIQAEAAAIVTKNLSDFPESELSKWGVTAQHPDEFLLDLCDSNKDRLLTILSDMAKAWRSPSAKVTRVLNQLADEIPTTVAALREALDSSSASKNHRGVPVHHGGHRSPLL
jgi:hypothetical protein